MLMAPASMIRARAWILRCSAKVGPESSEPLLKQKCVLVHKAQRHELGEASGLFLNFAEELELIHPVAGFPRAHTSG